MKKIKYLLIAFLAILLLTGCNDSKKDQTLTCSKKETDTGMDIVEKHIMYFSGDKVTNVDLKIDFTAVDEEVKNSWSTIVDMLDQQFTYDEYEGIEFSKSNSTDTYTWNLKVDLNKAKKEDLKNFSLEEITGSKDSYKTVKNDFEKDGYTCE